MVKLFTTMEAKRERERMGGGEPKHKAITKPGIEANTCSNNDNDPIADPKKNK